MYRFLRKNNKRILAVFTAGLMVVFIADMGIRGGRGGGGDVVVGHVGKHEVTGSQLRKSHAQWKLLKETLMTVQQQQQGQVGLVPLAYALAGPAFQTIDANADMFFLLQQEARNMGVYIGPEQVDSVLESPGLYVMMGRQPMPFSQVKDPQMRAAAADAMQAFLLVRHAWEQARTAIKVSEPARRHALATDWQTIKVNVAEFDAKSFKDKVRAPTTQDLETQFQTFAKDDPRPDATDGFGFGYRLPDRVKLQYIKLSHADLKNSAKLRLFPGKDGKSVDTHKMKVEAYKEYNAHPDKYQETKEDPLSQSPVTLGPISPLALTGPKGPTTKPFAAAEDQAVETLLEPEVKRVEQEIVKAIQTRVNRDYTASQSTGTTQSTYATYEYLQQLARDIELQYHVVPTVAQIDEWKSAKDLAAMPGVGTARIMPTGAAGDEKAGLPFAIYAITEAQPLRPTPPAKKDNDKEKKDEGPSLALYKLSLPLKTDGIQDIFLFRLTAAEPAHMPLEMAGAAEQVKEDWITAEAYTRAREAAEQLLEAARKQGLASAAQSAGIKLTTAGPFASQGMEPIENYPLDGAARDLFVRSGFHLLEQAAGTRNPHPVAAVELKPARKVVVMELASVQPIWNRDREEYAAVSVAEQEQASLAQAMLSDWYNYASLVRRLEYVPTQRGPG